MLFKLVESSFVYIFYSQIMALRSFCLYLIYQRVVHTAWKPWSDWSPCSVTCGLEGTQTRKRLCDHSSTQNEPFCKGLGNEVNKCNNIGNNQSTRSTQSINSSINQSTQAMDRHTQSMNQSINRHTQ